MPTDAPEPLKTPLTSLPFPPLMKSHILNCSYNSWYPRYRSLTPKARFLPIPQPFLDYLRADGIVLPHDEHDEPQVEFSDTDSGVYSSAENDAYANDDEDVDPAAQWRDFHDTIEQTIEDLGGKVVPKLNWSAPKDATWINATNAMECTSANDVYLLLKSSDFVTHDLEHAFDDCEDGTKAAPGEVPYVLVLRKYFQLNPSLEFRCFVRNKKLIAICQRDMNHFDFLFNLQNDFKAKIQDFFATKLRDTYPDENYAFDVYIPPPHERVWLIDVNPWAMRTDPLLFSWLELLTMEEDVVSGINTEDDSGSDTANEDDDVEDVQRLPIFRLIKRDDPEAYSFASQQYSAHKLPRDVVDASQGGEMQMREFADRWKELMERSSTNQAADSDEDS
jgi:hypothetical protein